MPAGNCHPNDPHCGGDVRIVASCAPASPTIKPLPVYIKLDGREQLITGWACPVCHLYHSPHIYLADKEEAMKTARQSAISCCHRLCQDCGVDMGKCDGWTCCEPCRDKHDEARRQERVAKAKHVASGDYPLEVFCVDDEFMDYEQLEEHIEEGVVTGCYTPDPATWPVLWACKEHKLKLIAVDIVAETVGHNEDEDTLDCILPKQWAELQAFLDQWCDATGIVFHEQDRQHTIVDMGDEWSRQLSERLQEEYEDEQSK